MRFEVVTYRPLKPPYTFYMIEEILQMIPESIQQQLLKDRRHIYVHVEAQKKDVISYLDNLFQVGECRNFKKTVMLEVDKSEIANFSYFSVIPNTLEMGRDIMGNIIKPTCPEDACPVGARLLSPLRITTKKAKKVGFYSLYRPWCQPYELIIASHVKTLFESEGIEGLLYEPCLFIDEDYAKEMGCKPLYLARIKRKIYEHADEIQLKKYFCREHNIPYQFHLFGNKKYVEDVTGHDFIEICGVKIKGNTYDYHAHRMIISRRVLEVLLKHKIRSLTVVCFYLNEKFTPVILSSKKDTKTNARRNGIYQFAESINI